MAKRLTDTTKWKNPWFRSLPTKFKILYLYLIDECDNAGVIHLDFELISFILRDEYDQTEFNHFFKEKVFYISGDKIIIKNFIAHQDNYNNPMMRKHVDKALSSHGILERYRNGDFK